MEVALHHRDTEEAQRVSDVQSSVLPLCSLCLCGEPRCPSCSITRTDPLFLYHFFYTTFTPTQILSRIMVVSTN
jgi:hypothetical protein